MSNNSPRRLERHVYRPGNRVNGFAQKKMVLTEIDSQFYLQQIFVKRFESDEKWELGYATRTEFINQATGRVMCIPHPSGVSRYFDHLIHYEGWKEVGIPEDEFNATHIISAVNEAIVEKEGT